MIKKIGILNFQHSELNYGALLQAVALQDYVANLGYEVETIDFQPEPKKGFLQQVKYNLGIVVRLMKLHKFLGLSEHIGSKYVFEKFRKQFLNRTPTKIYSFRELESITDCYDAIIVGSDQVWRPKYTWGKPLEYFLSFAGDKCRRISYAASFGVDTWDYDECLTDNVRKELNKFKAISVRESSGVDICKNIFGQDAEHVLDPTLLCGKDYFDDMINNDHDEIIESKLVYYVLDRSEIIKTEISSFASHLELGPVNIFFSRGVFYQKYTEVTNWLNKLRTSSFIITDSFHCVCFAIIFNKQFICLANPARGVARLDSLLGKLNLKNRICYNIKELGKFQDLEAIDYRSVNNMLANERTKSVKFLKRALSSEK